MFAGRHLAVLELTHEAIDVAREQAGPFGLAFLQNAILKQVKSESYLERVKVVKTDPKKGRFFVGYGNLIVFYGDSAVFAEGVLADSFEKKGDVFTISDRALAKTLKKQIKTAKKQTPPGIPFSFILRTADNREYLFSAANYDELAYSPTVFMYADAQRILITHGFYNKLHKLIIFSIIISLIVASFGIVIIRGMGREARALELANSYVRKLECEIEERASAEEELQMYRDNLEQLVEKRTNQLKKTTEDLNIAERLAIIGKFAGNVAHEIRNPLAAIGSSAYLIKTRLKADDAVIAGHIKSIDSQIKICGGIIDGILQISKMQPPLLNPVSVKDCIDQAIDTSHIGRDIHFKFDYPPEEIYVKADFEQLRMALKNLTTNAAQAMANSGTISFSAARSNGKVRIRISDTGPGLPPDSIGNIFQPLYSTKSSGMGFGLPIARTIIERHNGEIEAESEPGSGAVFTITLDAAETP